VSVADGSRSPSPVRQSIPDNGWLGADAEAPETSARYVIERVPRHGRTAQGDELQPAVRVDSFESLHAVSNPSMHTEDQSERSEQRQQLLPGPNRSTAEVPDVDAAVDVLESETDILIRVRVCSAALDPHHSPQALTPDRSTPNFRLSCTSNPSAPESQPQTLNPNPCKP